MPILVLIRLAFDFDDHKKSTKLLTFFVFLVFAFDGDLCSRSYDLAQEGLFMAQFQSFSFSGFS